MPRNGEIQYNRAFFDGFMKTAKVDALTRESAERVLAQARATAPVKEGDYKARLRIERKEARFRAVYRIVGTDWKTMIIEARLGVLVRALKAAARS